MALIAAQESSATARGQGSLVGVMSEGAEVGGLVRPYLTVDVRLLAANEHI